MASIPSFIFGGDTKYKTQEEVEAAREQVRAMLGDIGDSGLTGWGSFMADIGKGIGARIDQGRIDEGQAELLERQGPFSQTLAEIAGGGYAGGGEGSDTLTGGSGSDSLAGGVGGDSGGRVSEDAIRQGLIDRGLPPHVAEGFVMNMKDESGLRTDIREGKPNVHGTRGFGLYQATGPREVALRKFAQARGTSPTDLATNLDFLIYEGQTTEKAAFDRILNTSTPGEAGAAIVSNFLRPAKKHEIARRNKYLSTDQFAGGGGSNALTGGGAGDSFLQAKPNRRRMTPAMLEQEAGTEARPIWNDSPLAGRRRMTPAMTGIPGAVPPVAPVAAPAAASARAPITFDLHDRTRMQPGTVPDMVIPAPTVDLATRRRMTPAMLDPAAAPAPAPLPAPDPARFGATTPPVPVAAPLQAPDPARFASPAFQPPAPQIYMPPAAPRGNRLGTPPVPGQSMAGTETAPPQFASTPAKPPIPVARQQVDPFTDMILGDKASQFRPGNVSATPPAETARGLAAARQLTPFGATVFPVAPPAPGTPAAAGFGMPQEEMAGGGGANRQVGGGAGDASGQQRGGGGPQDVIGKLMFIIGNPYASDEQKRMATAMLNREYALEDERRKAAAEKADPAYKLGLRKAELEVQGLEEKNNMEDVVVVGNRLYNKKTKEWVTPPDGGKGPFDSTSVEGQALNGMVENGTLTVQQAYDLATGKTVTDAKGRTLFFTGTELVGARPGETPQPIDPNAAPQPNAPAAKPGATPGPSGGRVLAEGDQEKAPTNFRWIDENDHSKGTEPVPGGPGEQMPAELAARVGLANDALKILPNVEEKVKQGLVTGAWDWASAAAGRGESGVLYREIRAGSEALVRMLTGAGKNESEARDEASMYLPQAWDDAPTLTSKIQQLQRRLKATVTEAEMGRRAARRDLEEGARRTKTGVTWSAGG